eukprot:GEMP01037602.1.p1 GENE.GEMP01037602.1~~GEMP01037602.1.p1  ORF type:complete len:496 (+),score=110.36 GEMP01037602.1:36-1490(+)
MWLSTAARKSVAPPLVYIKGEEMSRYCMQLFMDRIVEPRIDTSKWEFFDLSCKSRDATDDKVMADAVTAGKRIKAIFKEPTVTPSAEQAKLWGLKKQLPSPNGHMRRGWNGITISRDTIHIPGVKLGYQRPVLFERHAVGGEYGAGWNQVGRGRLLTTFFPDDSTIAPTIVDGRELNNDVNVAVVYHNPLDNVGSLAEIFFDRCLKQNVTPYVVTKKTVFKWQEGFWQAMEKVFLDKYIDKFITKGLLDRTNGKLAHLISDAATMQIIRWTDGGFGMACHNYDGDMLTDEVAQVHRSPGFITSNLIGKADDGTLIKEYEASHGTVADLWEAHLRGEETSMNPLGMVEALCSAMEYSGELSNDNEIIKFGGSLRTALQRCFIDGEGTRDMQGKDGLTTEEFVDAVARKLDGKPPPKRAPSPLIKAARKKYGQDVDEEAVKKMFDEFDLDGDGRISIGEFRDMVVKLNIAPIREGSKKLSLKEEVR